MINALGRNIETFKRKTIHMITGAIWMGGLTHRNGGPIIYRNWFISRGKKVTTGYWTTQRDPSESLH